MREFIKRTFVWTLAIVGLATGTALLIAVFMLALQGAPAA